VTVGLEAHACLLQTVMDQMSRDVQIFVIADATSFRNLDNHTLVMPSFMGGGADRNEGAGVF
jgi:isochorismate hydrolase